MKRAVAKHAAAKHATVKQAMKPVLSRRTQEEIQHLTTNVIAPKVGLVSKNHPSLHLFIRHVSEEPFMATVQLTEDFREMHITLPPTVLARDESHQMPLIVECMDGKSSNPAVDMNIPTVARRMMRAHTWTDRRLSFTIAHELGHIVNDDYKELPKESFFKFFGMESRMQNMLHRQEFGADRTAASTDKEFALGGLEHLCRLMEFYDIIATGLAQRGYAVAAQKMDEARRKTHPPETERVRALLDVLETVHSVPRVTALRQVLGPDSAEGKAPVVPEVASMYSRLLGLSHEEASGLVKPGGHVTSPS